MIVQEFLENNLVHIYSDQGMMIHGGFPEGDYAEAIDPIYMNRTYVETDIPIETEFNSEDEEYAEAGRILMGAN